jgi:PIN like domain
VGLIGVPRHFREMWPTTVRTLKEVFGAGKVADAEWMARADDEGWVAVCKDDKIRYRLANANSCLEAASACSV